MKNLHNFYHFYGNFFKIFLSETFKIKIPIFMWGTFLRIFLLLKKINHQFFIVLTALNFNKCTAFYFLPKFLLFLALAVYIKIKKSHKKKKILTIFLYLESAKDQEESLIKLNIQIMK